MDNGAVSVDDLLSEYRAELEKLTQRERAERELQIYLALGGVGQRREVLKKTLGGNVGEYELRQTLLGADEWADPLWELWDKGTPVHTVHRLLIQTRQRAKLKSERCSVALQRVLDEYRQGWLRHTAEGKAYYAGRAPTPEPPPAPAASPPEPRGGEDENRLSKAFAEQLRIMTSQFVRTACAGLEDYDASKITDDFTGYVREALDDLRRKLTAARKRIRAKQDQPLAHVTRASFDHACEILVVHGKHGKPIDLREAKRRMLRRAADAHPDRWGGSTHAVEEYQAIIGAYSVLEQYMEELTARNERTRSP